MGDGELIGSHKFDEYDLGNISELKKTSGNEFVLIGSKGMAVLNSETPDSLFHGDIDGRVRDWIGNDRRLLVKGEKVLSSRETLHVFDLNETILLTDFTLTSPDKKVYGDLMAHGFVPIDDFKKVITIDEGGIRVYQL